MKLKLDNRGMLILGITMLIGLLVPIIGNAQAIDANTPWIWKGGDTIASQPGIYGTKGIPSTNNKPGARIHAASWTDNAGRFWLFGGAGSGSGSNKYNDLWRYTPSTGEWTWISGDSTANGTAVAALIGVPSVSNTPSARGNCNYWKDNNGNLWLHAGGGGSNGFTLCNDLWKFNPSTLEWTWVKGSITPNGAIGVYGTLGVPDTANMPGARNSGACWADGAGNLWLFGGQGMTSTTTTVGGIADLWKYDIAANAWTWVSGSNLPAGANHLAVYGSIGVAAATNKPGGRASALTWVDTAGKFWMLGGLGFISIASPAPLNDLWKFDPVTNIWTWMHGSNVVNNQGTYISQGVSTATGKPKCRFTGTSWVDLDGNFWLFGGVSGLFPDRFLNDVWKYNVALNEWTWVKGGSVNNTPPLYNTLNIPNPANEIGARGIHATWREKTSNNIWVFGGNSIVGTATMGVPRNDLWKIEPCIPMSGTMQAIAGPDSLCANDTVTYAVTALTGALGYNWTVPAGWTILNSGSIINVETNNTGGIITVQAFGNCGDSSSILSKSVYVEDLANPVISQTPLSSDTVLLSLSGAYTTYQWFYNSSAIPGATSATYEAYQNGVYSVAVTSDLGCSAIANPFTVSGITSIDDPLAALENIKIYPNPAANMLQVYAGAKSQLTISDIQGRKLLRQTLAPGVNSLDISKFISGIYLVTFELESDSHIRVTRKLVKK